MVHELFDLTGKVALVTGGSKGLGMAMARGLAQAGADIVINSRSSEEMEQAMTQMGAGAANTAMLGDRLETDILAGQRANLLTLLVLSGITDRAMLAGSEIQPGLVFQDVGHLHAVWQEVLDG